MNLGLSFLIMIAFGLILTWIFEFILKTNKRLRNRYYRHHEIMFGYHIHHSMYGILAFAIAIIYLFLEDVPKSIAIFGVGVGVILMHTIAEGKFVFMEKQKR